MVSHNMVKFVSVNRKTPTKYCSLFQVIGKICFLFQEVHVFRSLFPNSGVFSGYSHMAHFHCWGKKMSFIHPCIHPSFHQSVHPSIRPSIHPYIRTSIHLSIHLSVHPSIHQFRGGRVNVTGQEVVTSEAQFYNCGSGSLTSII